MTAHNSGRVLAFRRDLINQRELELFHREMARQDNLDGWSHDSGCACWTCIGRLQASVVQAYVRRVRASGGISGDGINDTLQGT
jgi:hypothetical protein